MERRGSERLETSLLLPSLLRPRKQEVERWTAPPLRFFCFCVCGHAPCFRYGQKKGSVVSPMLPVVE